MHIFTTHIKVLCSSPQPYCHILTLYILSNSPQMQFTINRRGHLFPGVQDKPDAAGEVWHDPVSTQSSRHSSAVNSEAFPQQSPADHRSGQQDQTPLQGLPLQLSEDQEEASHKVHVCAMQQTVVCYSMFRGVPHSKKLLKERKTHINDSSKNACK